MKPVNTPQILMSLAKRAGCEIFLEPSYKLAGQIRFPDGRKFYFKNTSIDINNHGASEVARDKGYTRAFMEDLGFRIPRGATFFSDFWCEVNNATNGREEAIKFARDLGYPLILKPNSRGQGKDVYKIYSEEQLRALLPAVFEKNNVVLLEEFITGADYRVVVLGDEVMMAYRRVPLTVVGDGDSDIEQLLTIKRSILANSSRKITIEPGDYRISERLKNYYGVGISHVPKKGETIILLDNANLSSGGEAIDVTDEMHESKKNTAIKLTKDLGLMFAGVDFITSEDISRSAVNPIFIEINCSPGLLNYRALNAKARERVDDLYLKILLSLRTKGVRDYTPTAA